jgi:type II secretory pathway pseudopilin PulG
MRVALPFSMLTLQGTTMESKNASHTPPHRVAFTLVELLVIVAIIALLIAVLLPVLGRAKHQAMNTVCIGNQRQIAMGATAYAMDNRSCYPAAKDPRYDDSPHVVVRYEASGNVIKEYRKDLIEYFGGSVKRVWTCPLAKADWDGKGGWQTGGGYNGNWPRYLDDLNSTRNMAISYAFFFGVAQGTIGGPLFKAIGAEFPAHETDAKGDRPVHRRRVALPPGPGVSRVVVRRELHGQHELDVRTPVLQARQWRPHQRRRQLLVCDRRAGPRRRGVGHQLREERRLSAYGMGRDRYGPAHHGCTQRRRLGLGLDPPEPTNPLKWSDCSLPGNSRLKVTRM